MNVLVLGGGFIGSALCQKLDGAGVDVTLCSRSAKVSSLRDVDFVHGDIFDVYDIIFKEKKFDVILYCFCPLVPARSFLTSAHEVEYKSKFLRFIEFVKNSTHSKIIYISSGGAIYGDVVFGSATEEAPCNPCSDYGKLKLWEEGIINSTFSDSLVRVVIARPGNPYALDQDLSSGVGFVAACLRSFISREPVTLYGEGNNVRDYIYLDDLTNALVLACLSEVFGVFNVSSGVGATQLDVIELMSSEFGFNIEVRKLPARLQDVQRVVIANAKISSELRWRPAISLEQGVAILCRRYVAHA